MRRRGGSLRTGLRSAATWSAKPACSESMPMCGLRLVIVRQIAMNAGQDGAVVVQNVRQGKGGGYGYNAAIDKYEDLVKSGVIDPVKVVRTALQDAASVAGLLITTEAMVAEKPSDAPAAPPMPDMGGMGGMM